MKAPLFFALTLALAVSASAQKLPEAPPEAKGQAIDPPATTGDKDTDGRRPWDTVPAKKIVKMSNAVKLFAIKSLKTKNYYMIWRYTDHRSTPMMHVFADPTNGKVPVPPKEYFLTRQRLPTKPSVRSKAHPAGTVQTWNFAPESGSAEYGMIAEATDFGEGKGMQKAKKLYPILWWGLDQGQELDEMDAAELATLVREKKFFPKDGK